MKTERAVRTRGSVNTQNMGGLDILNFGRSEGELDSCESKRPRGAKKYARKMKKKRYLFGTKLRKSIEEF